MYNLIEKIAITVTGLGIVAFSGLMALLAAKQAVVYLPNILLLSLTTHTLLPVIFAIVVAAVVLSFMLGTYTSADKDQGS